QAAGGLLALAAIVLAVWILAPPLATGQSPGTPAGPGGTATVTQPGAAGAALFLHSCASCHGPQGAGTLNGPDIRSAGAALADFVLRTGRMPLPAPGPQ